MIQEVFDQREDAMIGRRRTGGGLVLVDWYWWTGNGGLVLRNGGLVLVAHGGIGTYRVCTSTAAVGSAGLGPIQNFAPRRRRTAPDSARQGDVLAPRSGSGGLGRLASKASHRLRGLRSWWSILAAHQS